MGNLDDLLVALQEKVDEKGELHLDSSQTAAIVRWLTGMVILVDQQQESLLRLHRNLSLPTHLELK